MTISNKHIYKPTKDLSVDKEAIGKAEAKRLLETHPKAEKRLNKYFKALEAEKQAEAKKLLQANVKQQAADVKTPSIFTKILVRILTLLNNMLTSQNPRSRTFTFPANN